MGSRGISAVPIQDVAQVVLTHLRVPRDLKSTVRGILQWFPSLTGLVYVLLSASIESLPFIKVSLCQSCGSYQAF